MNINNSSPQSNACTALCLKLAPTCQYNYKINLQDNYTSTSCLHTEPTNNMEIMYLSLCLEDIVLSEGTHKLMCYIGRHVIKPFRTHDVFHVTSSEPDTVIS